MSLHDRLADDVKQAMKARDSLRVTTLRGVRAAIRNKEIEVGGELDDEGIVRVLRTLVKQRGDSIEQYQAAGRSDLEQRESQERDILQAYLPQGPSEAEIEQTVRAVIDEAGATGPSDLGRVMGPALKRLGAGVDGKQVNAIVRRILSAQEPGAEGDA